MTVANITTGALPFDLPFQDWYIGELEEYITALAEEISKVTFDIELEVLNQTMTEVRSILVSKTAAETDFWANTHLVPESYPLGFPRNPEQGPVPYRPM